MKFNRKIVFLVLVFTVVSAGIGLFAQSNTGTSLTDIDAATRSVATDLSRALTALRSGNEAPRVTVGQFVLDGGMSDLGTLWAQNISATLTEMAGRNYTMTPLNASPAAMYTVQGEIMKIANTVRIYTKVVKSADASIVWSKQTDFASSPFLAEMMVTQVETGGVRRDGYENDSQTAPVPLAIGSAAVARTLHQGDEDWFQITASGAGLVTVATEGSMDTKIVVYQGSTSTTLAEDDDSGIDSNASCSFMAQVGGRYLVNVSGYDGETGSYSISALIEQMQDNEPNNTREQATRLQLDSAPVRTSFSTGSDEDWYRVTIPAGGGYLQIFTSGSKDTKMELYDNRGNQLAEDDDGGEDSNARIRRMMSAGDYFARVTDYDESTGIYSIQAGLLPVSPADQYEPDDSRVQAKPITIGGVAQQRNFNTSEDVDWAVLNVTREGRYAISSRAATRSGLDTVIEVYDMREAEVGTDDDGGEDYDANLEVFLSVGTYYIRIRQIDSEVPGDGRYELSVKGL